MKADDIEKVLELVFERHALVPDERGVWSWGEDASLTWVGKCTCGSLLKWRDKSGVMGVSVKDGATLPKGWKRQALSEHMASAFELDGLVAYLMELGPETLAERLAKKLD